jgi:hypothetical protein
MQNNEHNPVAVRIGKIQKIWKEKVYSSNSRYINILASHDDMSLVEGFLKLEVSQYGSIQAAFHIMLTPFHSIASFSYHLILQWIGEFEKEKTNHPSLDWKNLENLKYKFSLLDKESTDSHKLLIELMEDYYDCFIPDIPFYLGIKPKEISNMENLTKWFNMILPILPANVSILTVDVHEAKKYQPFLDAAGEKGKNLIIPSLDVPGAYQELMTQGNPADPQVEYRKCMLEMGKATGEKKKDDLHRWGERMLTLTQATGDRTFWASAHLVYAGFLLNFSEFNKINSLLDKGIRIVSSEEKEESTMLLLQFYTMKGTSYNIQNETQMAIGSFLKQIAVADEKNIPFAGLQGYLYLFMIATPSNLQNYKQHIQKAYLSGMELEDEMLNSLNYGFIADLYLEHCASENRSLYNPMSKRMEKLYGSDWKNTIRQTRLTMKNTNHAISQ